MFALGLGWLAPLAFNLLVVLIIQTGLLHPRWHAVNGISESITLACLSIPFWLAGGFIDLRMRFGVSIGNVYCVLSILLELFFFVGLFLLFCHDANRPPIERTMPVVKSFLGLIYLVMMIMAKNAALVELNRAGKALKVSTSNT